MPMNIKQKLLHMINQMKNHGLSKKNLVFKSTKNLMWSAPNFFLILGKGLQVQSGSPPLY